MSKWWREGVLRISISAFVMLAFVLSAGPASADELSRLFRQILRDPQNIELNMRYAQLAEDAGQNRKALAAYERVLEADPSHPEASTALRRIEVSLIPVVTRTRVEAGGIYETNPRQLPPGFGLSEPDDFAGFVRMRITDQRPLFNSEWRSELTGFANFHGDIDQLDYWRARLHTGPVIELGNGTTLQVAPGAEVAFLDSDYFYAEPALQLTFENILGGAIDRLDIRGAFRDIANTYASDDGFVLDANARKTFNGIVTDADAVLLQPFFRMREATGTGTPGGGAPANFLDGDYVEFGGRLGYYQLIAHDVRLGAIFTGYYRDYEQNTRLGATERHDWYIAPEAEALFRNVICPGCDVRMRYRFEQNFSNDGTEDFINHTISASGIKRF